MLAYIEREREICWRGMQGNWLILYLFIFYCFIEGQQAITLKYASKAYELITEPGTTRIFASFLAPCDDV